MLVLDTQQNLSYNNLLQTKRASHEKNECGACSIMDIRAIKQLSCKEKLRIMEAIWEELSHETQSIQSPEWHQSVLKETEERVQAGNESILDWKEGKEDLRKLFD